MLTAMATRAGSAEDLRARMRIYEEDLRQFPASLVRAVITDFRQGRLGDGRFAPSGAEIAIECRRILEGRAGVERARHEQARLDAETLAERGRRQRAAEARDEDWRERAEASVEQFKRGAAVAGGKVIRGDDWATQPRTPTKVENFSDKLLRQFAGEEPIGAGTLGAVPLIMKEAAE